MANPSKTDWGNLYQAAIQYKKTAPWVWMGSEDLFAVENPANGQIGYCSILGNGGQEFGLGIFLGEDGYGRYLRLLSDEPVSDDFTEGIMTPMLSLLFADRRDLDAEDMAVIRTLGLQIRGRNEWPLFRSQRAGYAPWFLDKGEAVFLTSAIEQALVVADRSRGHEIDLYKGADDNLILTRRLSKGQWADCWSNEPLPQRISTPLGSEVSEALVAKMATSAGVWEFDIFALPSPIGPRSARPYFPLCFLAVDEGLGLVVANETSEPWGDIAHRQKIVLGILERANRAPRTIRVKSLQVQKFLRPIARRLGMSLELKPTPKLDEFKDSLIAYLH